MTGPDPRRYSLAVRTADDFLSAIDSKNPGDQVLVTVEREGHRLDVSLVLEAEK